MLICREGATDLEVEQVTTARNLVQTIIGTQANVFFQTSHQLIYNAILRLQEKSSPVSYYLVCEDLASFDDLKRVGGAAEVFRIVESVATSLNAEWYARQIMELYQKRLVLDIANSLIESASSESPLDEIIQTGIRNLGTISTLADISEATHASTGLEKLLEELEDASKGVAHCRGIGSGIPALDQITSGFQPGELAIVGARASAGKSTFARNVILNTGAVLKQPTVVFSMEMPHKQLQMGYISQLAGISHDILRAGILKASDWDTITQACLQIEKSTIYHNDVRTITMPRIKTCCQKVAMSHGKLSLVVVDYLQLMQGAEKRDGTREQEVAYYARGLKNLAMELEVPVLALSQLNRGLESRENKRPRLSDLRESGELEQAADIVVMIYRDDLYRRHAIQERLNITEFIVSKNRSGSIGTARVNFDTVTSRFVPMERDVEYA